MRVNNIVAFQFGKLSHEALLVLANAVRTTANGNANYPAPVNPTLLALGTLITNYSNALTAWGPPGNRGSRVQHTAVMDTRALLEDGLNGLALYAENTTPGDRSKLETIEWPLRKLNEPNGPLGSVLKLRQLFKDVLQGTIKLKWNKPAGSEGKNVKNYRVMRSNSPIFADAVEVALIGKTLFIDETPGPNVVWYWIIAVNAAGNGVTSASLPAQARPVA